MAIGLHHQAGDLHTELRGMDPLQRMGEFGTQAVARHFEHVADTRLTRTQFQVGAAAALQVQDVALVRDQHGRHGEVVEQGLLGEFAQRGFHGGASCGG